jgi:hypothetical protein
MKLIFRNCEVLIPEFIHCPECGMSIRPNDYMAVNIDRNPVNEKPRRYPERNIVELYREEDKTG